MHTLNGKLITDECNEFDNLKLKLEHLGHQVEHLEQQMTTLNQHNQLETLKHLKTLQWNLQTLEKLYRRLLSITLLTGIGIITWSMVMSFHHLSSPEDQLNSRGNIRLMKLAASR